MRPLTSSVEFAHQLKLRPLTKLYNERPTWLQSLHAKLDSAVASAYRWPSDLTDVQIVERLLALNLARANESAGSPIEKAKKQPASGLLGESHKSARRLLLLRFYMCNLS